MIDGGFLATNFGRSNGRLLDNLQFFVSLCDGHVRSLDMDTIVTSIREGVCRIAESGCRAGTPTLSKANRLKGKSHLTES